MKEKREREEGKTRAREEGGVQWARERWSEDLELSGRRAGGRGEPEAEITPRLWP